VIFIVFGFGTQDVQEMKEKWDGDGLIKALGYKKSFLKSCVVMLPRSEGRLLFAFARYLIAMITVDILYNEACEHYPKTIQYVKNILAEEGIDAVVNEINVATEEQAKQFNFVGSPTIRINGEDIESEAEQRQGHVRDTCRVYNYKGQMYVTPQKEFIRAALKKHR